MASPNQYQCKVKDLSFGEQEHLKNLFAHNGWDLLEQVIAGKAMQLEVNALNAQREFCSFEKYSDKALGELRAAARFRTALEVLREVAGDSKPPSKVEHIHA